MRALASTALIVRAAVSLRADDVRVLGIALPALAVLASGGALAVDHYEQGDLLEAVGELDAEQIRAVRRERAELPGGEDE